MMDAFLRFKQEFIKEYEKDMQKDLKNPNKDNKDIKITMIISLKKKRKKNIKFSIPHMDI